MNQVTQIPHDCVRLCAAAGEAHCLDPAMRTHTKSNHPPHLYTKGGVVITDARNSRTLLLVTLGMPSAGSVQSCFFAGRADAAYLQKAVQFQVNRSQFDIVRSSARTPQRGVRVDELTKSKKNTHPENIAALDHDDVRRHGATRLGRFARVGGPLARLGWVEIRVPALSSKQTIAAPAKKPLQCATAG